MSSEYLDSKDVRKEIEAIEKIAADARKDRNSEYVTELDHYFWLTAFRDENGEIRFTPSALCDPEKTDGVWICNLVLKGGGTLGLAHAGFVAGIEAAGVRFAGLAGTSAGSIVALGIAAARGGDLLRSTTAGIVAATDTAPLERFIDGPRPVRMLIKHMLLGRSLLSPRAWYGLVESWRRLLSTRGLNYGDHFERWLEREMERLQMPTLLALEKNLKKIHAALMQANHDLAQKKDDEDIEPFRRLDLQNGPVLREPGKGISAQEQSKDLLKIIASAMPIGMKFELPRQMKYLKHEPRSMSPARLARMSMAIPAFFDPVTIDIEKSRWTEAPFLGHLRKLGGKDKLQEFDKIDALTFIDGGVFANLPVDSFDEILPDLPTVLVPLVEGEKQKDFKRGRRPKSLMNDALACVQAMRFQRDIDAYLRLSRRPTSADRKITDELIPRAAPIEPAPINTGDANWLNFVMRKREKHDLFLAGVRAARIFLEDLNDGKRNDTTDDASGSLRDPDREKVAA